MPLASVLARPVWHVLPALPVPHRPRAPMRWPTQPHRQTAYQSSCRRERWRVMAGTDACAAVGARVDLVAACSGVFCRAFGNIGVAGTMWIAPFQHLPAACRRGLLTPFQACRAFRVLPCARGPQPLHSTAFTHPFFQSIKHSCQRVRLGGWRGLRCTLGLLLLPLHRLALCPRGSIRSYPFTWLNAFD